MSNSPSSPPCPVQSVKTGIDINKEKQDRLNSMEKKRKEQREALVIANRAKFLVEENKKHRQSILEFFGELSTKLQNEKFIFYHEDISPVYNLLDDVSDASHLAISSKFTLTLVECLQNLKYQDDTSECSDLICSSLNHIMRRAGSQEIEILLDQGILRSIVQLIPSFSEYQPVLSDLIGLIGKSSDAMKEEWIKLNVFKQIFDLVSNNEEYEICFLRDCAYTILHLIGGDHHPNYLHGQQAIVIDTLHSLMVQLRTSTEDDTENDHYAIQFVYEAMAIMAMQECFIGSSQDIKEDLSNISADMVTETILTLNGETVKPAPYHREGTKPEIIKSCLEILIHISSKNNHVNRQLLAVTKDSAKREKLFHRVSLLIREADSEVTELCGKLIQNVLQSSWMTKAELKSYGIPLQYLVQ